MGQEESEAFLLECRNTKFVGDIHEAFHILPGYGALKTEKELA
jgi:hypothetical protein